MIDDEKERDEQEAAEGDEGQDQEPKQAQEDLSLIHI